MSQNHRRMFGSVRTVLRAGSVLTLLSLCGLSGASAHQADPTASAFSFDQFSYVASSTRSGLPQLDDDIDLPDVPAPAPGEVLAADELVDLARIAKARGITLDEAVEHYGWQNSFALLSTQIADEYPQDFSGALISDGSKAQILFKGPVPPPLHSRVSAFTDAEIQLSGGVEQSAIEIDSRMKMLQEAASSYEGVRAVISSYDWDARRFEVRVAVESTKDLARVESIQRDLQVMLTTLAGAVPVMLLVDNETMLSFDTAHGGGRLEVLSDTDLACTAGFNVVSIWGTPGLSTAGHCINYPTFENYSGAAEWATTFAREHRGDYGDVQFNTLSEPTSDDFYYDAGVRRDVSGVSNPVVGQTLCRFGHASGASCSSVADVSTCASYGSVTQCRLVRMGSDEADSGDSGGPWYFGSTAYGIHSGHVGTVWGTRDVWSRVTYLDEALDISVRTS